MEDAWGIGFLGRREKPNIKQIVKKPFKKSQKSGEKNQKNTIFFLTENGLKVKCIRNSKKHL